MVETGRRVQAIGTIAIDGQRNLCICDNDDVQNHGSDVDDELKERQRDVYLIELTHGVAPHDARQKVEDEWCNGRAPLQIVPRVYEVWGWQCIQRAGCRSAAAGKVLIRAQRPTTLACAATTATWPMLSIMWQAMVCHKTKGREESLLDWALDALGGWKYMVICYG